MNERNFDEQVLVDKYIKKLSKIFKEMTNDGIYVGVADIGLLKVDKIFKGYYTPVPIYENSKPCVYFRIDPEH